VSTCYRSLSSPSDSVRVVSGRYVCPINQRLASKSSSFAARKALIEFVPFVAVEESPTEPSRIHKSSSLAPTLRPGSCIRADLAIITSWRSAMSFDAIASQTISVPQLPPS
jgi:hypothetical protein